MYLEISIVSLLSFTIGVLAFAMLNKTSTKEKAKDRNTKLVTYFVITTLMYVSIIFVPLLLYILSSFLIFIALRELVSASEQGSIRPLPSIMAGGIILYFFAQFILNTPPENILFIYYIIVHFDGFCQVIGEAIGRRKLISKISPSKTWEGFIGGYLAAIIAGFLIYKWNDPIKTMTEVSLIVFSGFLGDALASWYKRQCGVKNYSNLIPGHGGVLDRFDSFFMAGAIFQAIQWFYSHP